MLLSIDPPFITATFIVTLFFLHSLSSFYSLLFRHSFSLEIVLNLEDFWKHGEGRLAFLTLLFWSIEYVKGDGFELGTINKLSRLAVVKECVDAL